MVACVHTHSLICYRYHCLYWLDGFSHLPYSSSKFTRLPHSLYLPWCLFSTGFHSHWKELIVFWINYIAVSTIIAYNCNYNMYMLATFTVFVFWIYICCNSFFLAPPLEALKKLNLRNALPYHTSLLFPYHYHLLLIGSSIHCISNRIWLREGVWGCFCYNYLKCIWNVFIGLIVPLFIIIFVIK